MIPAATIGSEDTVLVTGATGFTGSTLVRKLVAAGARVRGIARRSSNIEPLSDLAIDWYRGDVFDPLLVNRAAAGVTYVFSMATAYREGGATPDDFRRVHVDATRLLAEASTKNAALRRFVHVSTIGVHGHIESPPADENYQFAPDDAYQETKLEAEKWITTAAQEKGLPLTVLRPTAIYGPGDRRLLKLFKMATRPFFVVVGRGDTWYHLIHVEDLCDSMLLAATHPAALGQVIICGNPEARRLSEIGRLIADALGRPFRILQLPAAPFFLLADLCERVCAPLGITPLLYRRRVAFFTKDRCFDTRRLCETLGFRPRFSYEEGLRRTAEWYVEQGWLGRTSRHGSRRERGRDRLAGSCE